MNMIIKITAKICFVALMVMFKTTNLWADYYVSITAVVSYFTQVTQCNTACPSTHRAYTALLNTGSTQAICRCHASSCACDAGYTGGGAWDNGNCSGTSCLCLQSGCCTNCSTTSWSTCATGYQSKISATTCSNQTCNKTTSYQCDSGYYGSPTTCSAGCTICPTEGNATAYTTAAGNTTAVGKCWLSDGVAITDAAGTFSFSSRCVYN
ncbi:MAG: hypothetical protein LBJ73_05265 [Rickettsiales bacterium]|jgi:hypothetical protein|nr:hypothetical protein [Rickettsiales bacterium]